MDGPAHYIKPAGKTYTPAAVIFLDTESRQDTRLDVEYHTLRNFECQLVRRRDRRRPGEHLTVTGTSCQEIADSVNAWASYGDSTWLYCHNLTFDLTVSQLATYLGEHGWELSSRFAIGGDSMWAVLHKGAKQRTVTDKKGGREITRERVTWAHTLTLADSASLFPGPLAQLGPLVGVPKPALPKEDDSDDAWAARCHADVDIMRLAVLQLMDWWDVNDLGHWGFTGASQAWQTYKRTLDPKQVVIDHDPAILEFERQAVYGGRRDAFRVGPLPPGRYGEIDLEAAYTTVAASFPLPAKVACQVNDTHRALALSGRVPAGMLAEVTIQTSVPRWPCRIGNRVFYPVGRFKSVLAAPDIKAAAAAGSLVAVGQGVLFTLTNHLRAWADQVLGWVRDRTGAIPGAVRIWAKLAARAVIGKFAQKGWRTEETVGPLLDGWSVDPISDGWTGARGILTGVNGQYYISWADQRGEHERPAVLAWVEAHVRSRLSGVIAGPFGAGVLQCDTDGVMVSHTEMQRLAGQLPARWVSGRKMPAGTPEVITAWNDSAWPLQFREKTQFQQGEVYGPQHVVLDGKQRFAGMPKGATRTSAETWVARLWPGISWQAQNAPPGAYARPIQSYRVNGTYAAGWVTRDGAVRPVEAATGDDGTVALLPWKATRWAAGGDILGPTQAAWADGLWEPLSPLPEGQLCLI